MVKPDLGVKRVCPSCGARFYDLQKRPIECPKCAFTFEPEALLKQRRPRPVDTPVAQPVPAVAEPEEAEEAHKQGNPGTVILVAVFFVCFVLYYFANWKILSMLWKVG